MCLLPESKRRFGGFRRALSELSRPTSHWSGNRRHPGHPDLPAGRSAIPTRQRRARSLLFLLALAFQNGALPLPATEYGLSSRPVSPAYLAMPSDESRPLPPLLSQTGVFRNTRELEPAAGLIPYDVNVSFYSDGAIKSRWVSLPFTPGNTNGQVQFAATGEWKFPNGTVFVKHFEMPLDETQPDRRRRLETRLLVRDANGSVYGATYKWRPDNSDAELLNSNLTEILTIRTTGGGSRMQTWYYPSRQDCKTCHNSLAGGVLGLNTRQMNRELRFASGTVDNQLRAWNHVHLFSSPLSEGAISNLARLASAGDVTRSLEDRARSYLDVNCAYCHRPRGTVAYFDARYDVPVAQQGLVNGRVLIDEGVDKARVIAPNDVWRSVALLRVNSLGGLKMPPLAHETLDQEGRRLLEEWVRSLPGPKVLAPPGFGVRGGRFQAPLDLALSHPEPGAQIHFTTDGSAPTSSDPIYREPIRISESTTVRARAFKNGFAKSIAVQETFVFPTGK